jgi:Lon protease-like protein
MSNQRPLLPLFPLDVVLLPGMHLPLNIFEPRYKRMISECLDKAAPFGVLFARKGEPSQVGCSAHIERLLERTPDGRLLILTQGRHRFRVEHWDRSRPYLQGEVVWLEDDLKADRELVRDVMNSFRALLAWHGDPTLAEPPRTGPASFRLARSNVIGNETRQLLLECESEDERLQAIRSELERALPITVPAGGNGKLHT